MAVVTNPLVVRIFINSTLTGHENGWAERWPIWETNWNLALRVALQMTQARQRVLSSNAYIQWACLGTVEPPYYEQTVVTAPLYPLPQWGPAAFDMQGVLFDLNTTSGENSPRLLRAIDRTEVVAKRWIHSNMLIPWAPPALPDDLTTASKRLLWQNTLATFRQYAATQQPMSDGHHGPGGGYWVDPFQQIVYRQMSSRRWGRPWKRMSWEAAPFVDAPQFSPCGCVVTVNRISYAIPCRFGPVWQLRWIHYYEADDDAAVMTFQTPFCCWNRSLEYTDFTGVGEAKKFQRRNWTNGAEWGAAPGVMWTGPQSYFEGFAPEPPIPTPGFMRPACDTPVVPPGSVTSGGAGVGGVGITVAPFFNLEYTGGAGAGGLEDFASVLTAVGAGVGGLEDLVSLLDLVGGEAAGGPADLVGVAGGASGGTGVGGSEDLPVKLDLTGGAGMGGLADLVGLLDSSTGGAGGAGASDMLRPGEELEGGGGAGGSADLVGIVSDSGGAGAVGGSTPCSWLVQYKAVLSSSTGDTQSVTLDLPVLAGNQVVLCVLTKGVVVTVSCTDNQGNTYASVGGGAYNVPGGYLLTTNQVATIGSSGSLTITYALSALGGPHHISLVAFETDSSVWWLVTDFNAANSNSPQAFGQSNKRIAYFIMNSASATTITVASPWVMVEQLFGGSGPFAIGVAVKCPGPGTDAVFTVDDTNEWSFQSIGQ